MKSLPGPRSVLRKLRGDRRTRLLALRLDWYRQRASRGDLPLAALSQISELSERSELPAHDDRARDGAGLGGPVFILSAGWRSGSTLLQRLLMSSGDLLIWGEPYARCDYISKLSESFAPFAEGWPARNAIYDPARLTEKLHDTWIANMYPGIDDLLEAHRQFFLRLMAEPARTAGYDRWGFKETRLGAVAAEYLRLLFPQAHILCLVRDPLDSWRSYVSMGEMWFRRWPNEPVTGPRAFAAHWNEIASSFVEMGSMPRTHVLRYEDLVADSSTLQLLEADLALTIDRSVLSNRIRGDEAWASESSTKRVLPIGPLARRAFRQSAGATAEHFGYAI